MNFRTTVADQGQLNAAAVGKDNLCLLGQWPYGEAKAKHGHLCQRCRQSSRLRNHDPNTMAHGRYSINQTD
ncbi:MAG: hypothetical protein ABR878_14590 [Roseiarcus sp.]|jgi:hypothetical protein